MTFRTTRRDIALCMHEKTDLTRKQQRDMLKQYLIERLHVETDEDQMTLHRIVGKFCSKLWMKLDECSRNFEYFLKKNSNWLDNDMDLYPFTSTTSTPCRGRKVVAFADCSDRSKRRKTEDLRKTSNANELAYATEMSLRAQNCIEAANVIKEATNSSPTRPNKMLKAWKKASAATSEVRPYTPDEALSLFVEANLTKKQYQLMRNGAKNHLADIYPAYNHIREAKARCYPSAGILITESTAEVDLQLLLDHTTRRLVELQECVISILPKNIQSNLILISKWGCDGSSGQSQYKQKASEKNFTDSYLFVTSIVPLQLYAESDKTRVVIWHNPQPSSTRYCRPIRLQFCKESTVVIVQEKNYIDSQISSLKPTSIHTDLSEVTVTHKLCFTMIDGKVCNAVTDTSSSQRCNVCQAGPKEMNDLERLKSKKVNETALQYGLSPLHCWIRFFEYFIHLSYRLEIQMWQVRGPKHKTSVDARKKLIQTQFREQMGLLVDQPKAGGSGNSNDGNTSRRFFQEPTLSASITGVDESLIRRCGVILQAMSSGLAINVQAFEEYTQETAKMLVSKYAWYYMPTSVHKVLFHGSAIISAAVLPIGMLSEEAQEARNKDCKRYRQLHSRKISREATNQDLLNALLISSDPIISSMRNTPPKKFRKFTLELIKLLQEPEVTPLSSIVDNASESNSEDDT